MKKRFLLIALVAFCTLDVFGWGATGHRATGYIAEQYMSKKALKKVRALLGGQSLAMVTTWMDEVRSDSTFNHMTDWHWVTIPYGTTYAASVKNPNGDIIMTIERCVAELKTGKLSPEEQALRIRILAHLLGDLHQPLHVGGRNDRGGNDVKVNWFREESNLHRVWDSDMIDDTKLSYTELAESLRKPSAAELKLWRKYDVLGWAAESQSYEKPVYDIGNGKLGYRYSYQYFPIVRQRLLQAGIRLASILEEIYG